MRKLLTAVVIVCAIGGAEPAFANTDPDPGDPPDPITVTRILTVTAPSHGSITGDGIDCPGDCNQSFTYEVADGAPTVRLTAARSGTGWSPDWSDNCTVVGGACDITMSSNQTVSAEWDDVAAPTVSFYSLTGVIGPNRGVSVPASDNVLVSRVDFYVGDAITPAASDSSHPYGASLSALGLGSLAHGDTATIKVIAEDTSGNRSHTLASAPAAVYTVDRETALTGVTMPPAYTRDAPFIEFVLPADWAEMECRTRKSDGSGNPFSPCRTPPYQAEIHATSPEGSYVAELKLRDNASNTHTTTRTFVIDRTKPQLSITGGPAEGAVVNDPSQSFNFTSSDANPYTLECRLDSAAFGPCSGSDSHALNGLSAGDHTFTVRATDGAGNQETASRAFSVASASQTGSGSGSGSGSTGTVESSTTTTTTTITITPGGAVGGAVGGQIETPARLAAAARAVPKWSVRGGRTQVKRLVLSGLVKGAEIQVTCKGRGCAFKKKKLTARGGKANLTRLFKKRKLGPRSRIGIRVAFGDGSVRTIRYMTQKGKKKPKVSDRTA